MEGPEAFAPASEVFAPASEVFARVSEVFARVSEAVVRAPSTVVPAPPRESVDPGSITDCVVSVGSVGGSVVLVELLLLLLELVGGSVALVGGGAVVGGTVLVGGWRRRARVDGAASAVEVVEVVVRLVRGTITAFRGRVVGGVVEVAGETCWRWCSVVLVVVCEVASATCLGDVTRPTTLPPIAPISIAVATLTHRRSATNATGLKRRTPPVRVSCPR